MKLLIDTNILIDFLTVREPYFNEADKIMAFCSEDEVQGFVAAHSITNIFYVLRKLSKEERKSRILDLFTVVTAIGIDQDKLLKALNDDEFDDIEDCLQELCAEEYALDCIITRNVKDFKGGSIPAITPVELLTKINGE